MLRFAILAFAFATPALGTEFKPVPLSASQTAQIKNAIAYDMLDPGAAQFRNIRAVDVTKNNGTVIRRACGEVNGKNAMGGYVGFKMFGGVMQDGKFRRKGFFGPCEQW